MDRETETRLTELEAQIVELESKVRKDLAAVEVEVQKIDLRHENALLRQALQTSSENYAAHVKRVELILKVDSLRRSNDSLSGSIQTEVRNTQTEARTAIDLIVVVVAVISALIAVNALISSGAFVDMSIIPTITSGFLLPAAIISAEALFAFASAPAFRSVVITSGFLLNPAAAISAVVPTLS